MTKRDSERGRFSSRRKMEAVLRLLRGEDLDSLSRELQVTAATPSEWREAFVAGGQASLKSRQPKVRDEENAKLKALVGELSMRNGGAARSQSEVARRPPFGPQEVEVMSRACSPSTGRPYGVVVVCEEWGIARSTVDAAAARGRQAPTLPPAKRGPKTALTDAQLVEHIRRVLGESPFTGEGHRKVWARLRYQGIRTAKARVLRLLREHRLLAPARASRILGPRNHDGTLLPEAPDRMWGTDATTTFTLEEGQITVFIAVDHFTAEGVGIHAAKVGNRFEALEPIRQGIRQYFGTYAAGAASGLALRHDHGSQYMRNVFQSEIKFLGIESSPAFVRAPEGNGCAERFIRTLKEQLLWVHPFGTVEELRQALHAWLATYNAQWLIERHGHSTPAQVRRDYFDARRAA